MDFDIPSDVTVLDDEALSAAIEQARAASAEFDDIPAADLTQEQAERIVTLADFYTAARTEVTSRAEARTQREATVSQARAALAEVDPEPEPTPEPEPVAEVEDPPAQEPPAAAETPTQTETEPTPEAEVAQPSVVTRVAASSTPPAEPPAQRLRPILRAAADVAGFGAGQTLNDLDDVAKAVTARISSYPTQAGPVPFRSAPHGVAMITMPATEGLNQADYSLDDELLALASRESRLEGNSLTAAGDWGAPSETLYDLCSLEGTEGIIDLPEVSISRGGIRFTKGPDFETVFASGTGYIDQTEAQAAAATAKTSMTHANPSFTDVRLEAVGAYVQAGILTRQGYPELVRRYVELALISLQHKIALKVIGKMRTIAGSANSVANGFGTSLDLLHSIELLVEAERQRNRLPFGFTLEATFPHWAKAVIRADLAQRNGVATWNVSDAEIEGYFTTRGVRPQWLYNYQDITISSGYAAAYPATVDVMLYPAGTFVKGTAPLVTLNTLYDSTLLETNTYVELFTEQGILVANPCHTPKRISVPFAATGQTGAADGTGTLFVAP